MPLPVLAITTGDPAGCGPWVGARAALDPRLRRRCRPLMVGHAFVLKNVTAPAFKIHPIRWVEDMVHAADVVNVLHIPHPEGHRTRPGRPQRLSGEMAVSAVGAAVDLARSGRVVAVVTGPVSKESLKMAGCPHPGHTELLMALSGSGPVDMLMAADRWRALLITRHIPLGRVPRALGKDLIVNTVTRVNRWAVSALGMARPFWALCGLNPHGGDHGLLGTEEQTILRPAVRALKQRGVWVEGPLPADTVWARHTKGRYDLVACLYHDQALIPLKTLAADRLVNITAGLNFVRTSPGHGTAFDLAVGAAPYRSASAEPTVAAALTALQLAERAKRRTR